MDLRRSHNHLNRGRKGLPFEKHAFMIKVLENTGQEETHLYTIILIYKKPAVNSVLDGEKLEAIPLRLGVYYPTPQNCAWNTSGAIRQEEVIKGYKQGKKKPNNPYLQMVL